MSTARAATPEQLRVLADDVRAKEAGARAVIVRAAPAWTGPQQLSLTDGTAQIVAAGSPLAVRAALAEQHTDDLVMVLTDIEGRDLGLDVLAKVARQRVLRLDRWALVRSRFGLTGIDPSLSSDGWIADALVQYEPAQRWTTPASGFLQHSDAWRMLSNGWLGLSIDDGLGGLLIWLSTAGNIERLQRAPEEIRNGAEEMLIESFEPPARSMLRVAGGRAGDIVPLGIAARVVFAPSGGNDLLEARVRFALDVGEQQVSETDALRWASAAESYVTATLHERGRAEIDAWLHRAEALIQQFGATAHTSDSDLLPSGLEQRYQRSATVLRTAATGNPDALAQVGALAADVSRHQLAGNEPDRLAALVAATRLSRRLGRSADEPAETFPKAAEQHRVDSSWIDRARQALRRGDPQADLAGVYSELLAGIDERREHENQRFAELLVHWSAGEPGAAPSIMPIENTLDQIVAPLAGTDPVLLVVADGMSWSVATELLEDIEKQGWLLLEPTDGQVSTGVATLPTVTKVSRASLLCGKRIAGESPMEKTGFATAAAFAPFDGPPPVLFHKGDLTTPDGSSLSATLNAAVTNRAQRVVGVVINAIDDHLTRGDQIRVTWTLDSVLPLRQLLNVAAASGRTVIITSDHGHVLDDRRTGYRQRDDAAERWRPITSPALDDEVTITGPRVLQGSGTVIMPWTEKLRYGTPKHGYHGGATPQEVLVPVFVLARATAIPEGWQRTHEPPPSWWTGDVVAPAPPAAAPVPPPARTAPAGQGDLFETITVPTGDTTAATATWVDTLLASNIYTSRREAVSRAQLSDERVAKVLTMLDARGGSALRATIAADIEMPAFRVDGLVQALRRLLNIEGYAVIELQGDTIVLNRELLLTQFGVAT